MSKSLRPGTTISDQISILQSHGMSVDTDLATQWLTNVSYCRLSAYWFPARRIDSLGNEYYCEHSTFTGSSELSVGDQVFVGDCGWRSRSLMMSRLPAMRSPQNASRAPQEHAPGIDTDSHSQPFADSAIK